MSRYLVSRAVLVAARNEVPPHVAFWAWAEEGEPCVNTAGPGFDLYASQFPEGTKLYITVRAEEPAQTPLEWPAGRTGEGQ